MALVRMQTVLPATWIFFLFGLTFTIGNSDRNETCDGPTGTTYEGANCDFQRDACGWSNAEGNEIQWERSTTLINYNGYLRAPMSDARPMSVARLASPWFRATGNQQCSLQFQYYFRQEGNCQLAVYLDNDTSSMQLVWQTSSGPYGPTGFSFQKNEPIWLPHSNCCHRIIFEARKLTEGQCGYNIVVAKLDNEVDIDNIEFRCSRPLTATTAAGDRTVTTPSSPSAGVSSTGTTAASPSTTTVSSPHLSSSPESPSAGGEAGSGAVGDTKVTGTGRNIQLIAGVVLSVVVVAVAVLVIVYCRITNRKSAICCRNLKSQNASSSDVAAQSEQNGTGDRISTGLTRTNPAIVSDDGVPSAYYLARDQQCLCSVPNKPHHGKRATSNGHPKGDSQAANAGQDDYNSLSLTKSRAGPSASPKQRRAAQPYDHFTIGDEHHGDVTEPTPGDRRTGCGTRTLMADVLQSDEYNTLSITTLRASSSSPAATPSSARNYDHVPDGERGHQTWPAGDLDPTRASGQAEEVYEHTKWGDFISL